jgi:uncharacterized protein (TIGR01777 family)
MAPAVHTIERSVSLPVSADRAFAWHERPGAFERLTPPWEPVHLIERSGGIRNGARTVIQVRLGPLRMRWIAAHRDYVPGRRFVDEQVSGPFSTWVHEHRFEPSGDTASRYTDHIDFSPPFGTVGAAAGMWLARHRVERMVGYRQAVLRDDLAAHARFEDQPPMRIAITGATGLLGSAITPYLTTGGHEVIPITRRPGVPGSIRWDPASGVLDPVPFEGLDAVIHLAGENIGTRWTDERKRRIRESRVKGTRLLAETLARLARPPRVLVSASAMGIYGNRGNEVLTEDSVPEGPPSDFFVEIGREWEAATQPARSAGIRVVLPRFGLVLTPAGGALGRMLLPFRAGIGGPLGSGRQWTSWIAIDDAIGVVHHALFTDDLSGPVNAAAPESVTNREFASTLGRVLRRPAILPAPAPALRLLFGEMADTALLAGQRLLPAKLVGSGYVFRYPTLEAALRHVLGR